MSKRPFDTAFLALLVALSACAPPPVDNVTQAVAACDRGAQHDEIRESGTVARILGTRESRSGLHEGFIVLLRGRTYRVEDNADVTGVIPLRRGEGITLQGQFECDDYVIHWTHRDPSGRHLTGYVEVDGKYYN